MVDINWGILRPVDIGGAFNQGVEAGRQRRAESALDEQFRTMAQNPNAPVSNDLLRFAPQQAYQLSQQQRQQQKADKERDVKVRAAKGDKAAIAELAGIDWDAWTKISKADKDAIKARNDYMGNAALRISQAPEAQRPQLWDAAVQQGVQLGYSDLASFQGQYSPQSLEALIANSGQVAKLFELERPSYMAPVDGAPLINVKDPAAVNAWNGGGQASAPVKVTTIDEARALPPGTRFIDPNGVERTVPGGGAASNGGSTFPGWH